jgi:amidohydrolase
MNQALLIESIRADAAQLVDLRRDLHAHPETCYEELRTSDVIARTLSGWGIPVHRGLGGTGVVGTIKSGTSTRALGLRADMDALPITERNTFSHASRHAGKMHACGHDGHTAMLLATAKYLSQHREFDGTVHLIFQPAEEGGGGARAMIQDGLFDLFPMDAIFGVHNWPGLPVGKFAVRSGPLFASASEFRVNILGKAAHAAMPHEGIDPLLIGCQIVQAFQAIITRNKRPVDGAVISVTMFHAGEAANVVPDTCEIRGAVRTLTTETLDMIERRMRIIAESTCEAFEARCDWSFRRIYPPTVNHPKETEFVRRAISAWLDAQSVVDVDPTMASEDFSFYLLEKPGCFFLAGNGGGEHRVAGHGEGPCILHNPSYDFNDELIPLGGAMWARLAEQWFRSG